MGGLEARVVDAHTVDAHYGSLGYDGFYRREILEGRYTLAVLFEYAGTLGLLDLDVVATGALSTGDQFVLSGYAEHTADRAGPSPRRAC